MGVSLTLPPRHASCAYLESAPTLVTWCPVVFWKLLISQPDYPLFEVKCQIITLCLVSGTILTTGSKFLLALCYKVPLKQGALTKKGLSTLHEKLVISIMVSTYVLLKIMAISISERHHFASSKIS